MAAELTGACNGKVISGFRRGARIAGTGKPSLHASGRAIDMTGNAACLYEHLKTWPGGYSTDYARMGHVHISYAPGSYEWGARFVHGGGVRRSRYARRGYVRHARLR